LRGGDNEPVTGPVAAKAAGIGADSGPSLPNRPLLAQTDRGQFLHRLSGQGKPWTEFNKHKETITLLRGLTGTVAVTAQY